MPSCFRPSDTISGAFLACGYSHDPLKDFAPISLTVMIPNVLVVNAALPVASVKELVALAKAKPGELNAYVASGGSPTFALFLFQSMTGVKFTTVRYKQMATGLTDVAAGNTHVIFPTISTAQPLIKVGKIKALAVTSRERSPQAPDLPTVASSGYPKFESVAVYALIAPAKTPADIVNRLNREVVRFLVQSDAKAKIGNLGADILASSPADLLKFMQAETARMGPVFKEAGIKPGDLSD